MTWSAVDVALDAGEEDWTVLPRFLSAFCVVEVCGIFGLVALGLRWDTLMTQTGGMGSS